MVTEVAVQDMVEAAVVFVPGYVSNIGLTEGNRRLCADRRQLATPLCRLFTCS